jgi:RHS repeat-associated protein
VYQTIRYAVNPATGTVGNSLVDNTYYDASGNVIETRPSGSEAFTKSVYDGIGRTIIRYVGYAESLLSSSSSSSSSSSGSGSADVIFEQTETVYDAASNVIFVTNRHRFHNATGTGLLNGPSGPQPKSRDSFTAMWQDGIGRTIATANYGTNNNIGPPTRPELPPQSSNLILVSQTRYNERGEAFESIDPAGKVDRTYSDDAGRTVFTIQNYVLNEGCFCPGSEQNVTTEMRYGLGGQLAELIAKNQATGDQITRYEYGVTLVDSAIASNDLLRAEIYPDSQDSQDRVTYTYNRQGQRTSMRDQNGSVHEYEHDLLGRQTGDKVTTLGPGVDGAVLRIGTTYEVRGMVEKITSYSDTAGTTAVNEVLNVYNSFGQLKDQYQEHDGEVDTGATPKVQYAYADGSNNTIRPTGMTYPNGRELQYLYDDTHADKLSRIRTLKWDGMDVCEYAYLGLNIFVTTDYLEPQVKLDYALGSGANPYTGFDQFGRIVDLLWEKYGASSSSSSSSSGGPGSALLHLQYGYDRASNRTHRADPVAQAYDKDFDELYEYDGMHRLKKFHRGELIDENTAIVSPMLQQGWHLDATGNWQNFTQNDQVDASQALDQQRVDNQVNEITHIARTVGPNWATPAYDRNGNMTVIPQPKDMAQTFRGTWDAWNRLVKLEEPDGDDGWQTLAEYQYDGQTWRIAKNTYNSGVLDETRHFYFTSQWQVIEERLGTTPSNADAQRQYVWGLRYIDEIILRARDSDGNDSLDERLYAMQDANWNVVATHVPGNCDRFSYTPYGCAIYLNADFTERTSASMEVLFSGYFFEHITGLSIVRRRFLHTALGVWISRDAKQDRSGYVGTYRYCSNSPVGSVDPYGMFTVNDAAISHCKEKVPFGSLQEVIACANALPAQQRFDLWYSLELSDLSWLIGLPDCPCYLWPMASPPTPQELNKAKQCAVITAEYQFASELYQGADPTVWSKPATIKFSVFHPNAKWEIRSIKPNASGASQQCTYDGKGRLITGGVSAGTPDRYQSYSATWGGWFAAGGGYVSNSGHYGHDVDPFNLARELDGGKPGENVDRYLEVRPPNAGKKSDGQPCDKNIVD